LILPNGPAEARFLTPVQQEHLTLALRAEAAFKAKSDRNSVLLMLGNPRVLYLAAVAFLFMTGNYVTGFWMPQSIKAVGDGLSHVAIGLLVMVPKVIGLCAMILVPMSSSRRAEYHWHAAVPLIAAATAFCFVGTAATLP